MLKEKRQQQLDSAFQESCGLSHLAAVLARNCVINDLQSLRIVMLHKRLLIAYLSKQRLPFDSSKSGSAQLSSAQVRYPSLPESTDEELKQWIENPPDGSILQELLSSVGSVESLVDLPSNDVDMEL